jgi:hypothetical protein
VTVNLDKTGPDVEAEVTPDANAEGWYREDPTVSFKATDELSGIEEVSPETKVSTEGKDQVIEGRAVDKAGNSTSASEKVSLDKSPPEISNLKPEEGASLDDLRPKISAEFSDNLSGVDTDTARLALDGKAVESSVSVTSEGLSFKPEEDLSEGEHTVEVNVSDLATNAAEEKKTTFTLDAGGPPGGTNLTVLPSSLRVKDVGTTAPLTVYLEKDGQLTDISKDPETTYDSSNESVVLVDETGSMTFAGEGEAKVTVRNGELQAVTNIEVDANAPELIEGLIGPAGGNVTLPNGTGVSIPEDALAEKKTIRVEETTVSPDSFLPEDGVPVGKAYDFSPDGLTFDEPISIIMRYDPADIPSGYDEKSMLISTLDSNGRWVIDVPQPTLEDNAESGGFGIDLVRHAVQATTNHFSKRSITIDKKLLSQEEIKANDGTTLRVIKHIKQLKSCQGPTGPKLPMDNRTQSIDYVVLHNTAGGGKDLNNKDDFSVHTTFEGEVRWAASADSCTGGAYYVGKDGTIVQVSEDNQVVNHIGYSGPDPDNPSDNISKQNSIGIEIHNDACGPTSTKTVCEPPAEYPGAQVAGVVRLVDFLMRKHPGIDRPGPYSPVPNPTRKDLNRGDIRMHEEIPTPGKFRADPAGHFRIGTMGPPSLEEILYHALRENHNKGAITTKGGDAFGVAEAGTGGNVDLRFGDETLVNDADNARDTLVVPAGDTVDFTGPNNLMHLIVNGTLKITNDTNLDVDGIFYVGPDGEIDASGTARSPDRPNGRSLNIEADGFALIEGLIDTSGADREAPIPGAPPDTGAPPTGNGGSGGILPSTRLPPVPSGYRQSLPAVETQTSLSPTRVFPTAD